MVRRDAPPEWDRHSWDSLPRALALQGYCTDAEGSWGALADYIWGGFDTVDEDSCTNRNRGIVHRTSRKTKIENPIFPPRISSLRIAATVGLAETFSSPKKLHPPQNRIAIRKLVVCSGAAAMPCSIRAGARRR